MYQYFNDKHDILLEGIKRYAGDIFYPMLNVTDKKSFSKDNIKEVLKEMIDKFVENHKLSQSAHEEITAMVHSDKEIACFFQEHEMYMTKTLYNVLANSGFDTANLYEKVHIAINLIDDLCHEIVYHKHSELDYTIMTNTVIDLIANLLM